jgi:hypothetical protein
MGGNAMFDVSVTQLQCEARYDGESVSVSQSKVPFITDRSRSKLPLLLAQGQGVPDMTFR